MLGASGMDSDLEEYYILNLLWEVSIFYNNLDFMVLHWECNTMHDPSRKNKQDPCILVPQFLVNELHGHMPRLV
jgi:hypothetical protein